MTSRGATRTVVLTVDVGPGELIDVDIGGVEVVVWRGESGVLCAVVFAVMLAAVLYAAWIGISNFSRIHV